MRLLLTSVLMLMLLSANAQELKCNVTVNAQKISGVDQRVFQKLQQTVYEYMNNRAWTQDVYAPDEKIECSLLIILESNPSQDFFSGTIVAQSSRPVFNSTYSSPIINFRDLDLNFTYTENTPMEFNLNQYTSNLSSVFAYYAYLFIALDYESMGKGGGAKYFTNLETILNQVPNSGAEAKGWSAFDKNPISGNKTRYNIITSLQNPRFDAFKNFYSQFHLQGLDVFYDKPIQARQAILQSLEKLDNTFRDNPNNVLITLLMQTKGEELISIFIGAEQGEKIKAVTLLKRIDPANAPKYDKILKG